VGTPEPPDDAEQRREPEGAAEAQRGHDEPAPTEEEPPAFLEHPLAYLSWWWTEKQPSHITTLGLGILGTLLTTGLVVGVGVLISLLVGAGNVPGYALAIAVGVGLAIGLPTAWLITRAFYELKLRLSERTLELLRQRLENDLEDERRKLIELQPDREALNRLGAYSDYMDDLIEAVMRRDISLEALDGKEVERNISVAPQALLRKVAMQEYYVSIWVEGAAGRLRGSIHWIAEALPLGEGIPDRLLRFEVVCAPDHTKIDRDAFSVSVDESWLKWNHRVELKRQEERVYRVDKLPFVGLPGDDLQAFEARGYQSVRATSFQRDGTTCYIVVLAKTETAFSQIEERFLLWLRHALELDAALRSARDA
jgi:uncharacterized membrane protein YciS (DUF1049 family)